MDYLQIILIGFYNHREYLADYFQREANNAKGYSQPEFFNGLEKELQSLKANIYGQVRHEKQELEDKAKAMNPNSIPFQHTLWEIQDLRNKNFSVNLPMYSGGKYRGDVWFDELEFIESKIKEARKQDQPDIKLDYKLKLRQIALLYVYNGKNITLENSSNIAKEYGHTSGDKLYQFYNHYRYRTNRIAKPTPYTPKKTKNKIDLVNSVIELLPKDKQQQAKDELNILKNHYDNDHV